MFQQPTRCCRGHGTWVRFSLRSLFVVMAICGVALGVWVAYLQPFHREQRLLGELGVAGKDYFVRTELHGPWWLKRFAEGKYAQRVWEIQGNRLNDDDLAKLHRLRYLTDVALIEYNTVTDEGIKYLAELPSLHWLMLNIPISDTGLAHLRGRTDLESLFIESDKVTDDGMRPIGTLAGLRELALKCPITDEGLRHIGSLTELRVLRLFCPVTDEGMTHLESLKHLETLVCASNTANDSIESELNRKMRFEYVDIPLLDVVDDFAFRHALTCRLDSEGLARAGVTPLTTIKAELDEVQSGDALRAALEPLGLDWCWEGNGIVVTDQRTAADSRPGITKLKQTLPRLETIETDW